MRVHIPLLMLGLLSLFTGCASTRPTDSRFDYTDFSKPTFFPILPWEPNHGWKAPHREKKPDGLESIAECHFNLAGFVTPQDLPRCERLGLGAIVVPADAVLTTPAYFREWGKLSNEEIENRVKATVEAAGSSRAVVGYFIVDEPGVKEFAGLARAVAAVKKHAPGKLAYINLYPDYATIGNPDKSQLGTTNYTEYLERFVNEVKPQALSYDNYMVEMSQDLTLPAKAASYYRNLLEVRRVAQKYHLPCLNIVTANQIRPVATPPSPANYMFQVYTTLAAGYRGVTWFTYYQGGYPTAPIDSAGRKTPAWAWLKEVNCQIATLAPTLSRLTSTGVFFSAPAPADGLPLLPGKLVEAVTCPTPVMAGEFQAADGTPYVMVVNLSLERSARFTLATVQPYDSISIVSAMDGAPLPYDQKAGCWLTAGQGVLLRLGR